MGMVNSCMQSPLHESATGTTMVLRALARFPDRASVEAAGQRAPLWAVPTSDDRAAFVGEAYGVWLWLVMWPMSAAWLRGRGSASASRRR